MWKYQYSKMYRGITSDDVWTLWSGVRSWQKWFKILVDAPVAASFAVESSFLLQFQGEEACLHTIINITESKSFVVRRKLLGAILLDKRSMESTINGVRLTREFSLTGPFSFFWKRIIEKTVFYKSSIEFEYLATEARRMHYARANIVSVAQNERDVHVLQ
jgi:hypothetical protein